MLFNKPPRDYEPKHVIAICVIKSSNEILLLKRAKDKFKGSMWDTPGGKIHEEEDLQQAMTREIFEETGIKITSKELNYKGKVYIRYPEFDFTCNLFYSELPIRPKVEINPAEHEDYGWFDLSEINQLELVPDELERIKMIISSMNYPHSKA